MSSLCPTLLSGFIHSVSKHFLSPCRVPGTGLKAEHSEEQTIKTPSSPSPLWTFLQCPPVMDTSPVSPSLASPGLVRYHLAAWRRSCPQCKVSIPLPLRSAWPAGRAGPDRRGRSCASPASPTRPYPSSASVLAVTSAGLPSFPFCKVGQSSRWQMLFLQVSSSGDRKRMTLLIEVRSLEKGLA